MAFLGHRAGSCGCAQDKNLNDNLESFRFKENRITNLEMETSAIYAFPVDGPSGLVLNAIIANRPAGHFQRSYAAIERLIHLYP